jgi:diaminopimelate decarboxylase
VGAVSYTSTAGPYSKFGVALEENRRSLLEAFCAHEWLNAVHVHVGSQACPLDLLCKGVGTVLEFAERVNSEALAAGKPPRIKIFDIGGGLPAGYYRGKASPSLAHYRSELERLYPALFSGQFRLVTEFGRHINAGLAWAASRVEYVKSQCGKQTAIIHLGADLFVRECYNPADWHHDIFVLDHAGNLKAGPQAEYVIAGPLCFSGDIIERNIALPLIEAGDYIVLCDIGAYTLSMWSRYNSRQTPKVLGYESNGERFELCKEREKIEDVLRFWA